MDATFPQTLLRPNLARQSSTWLSARILLTVISVEDRLTEIASFAGMIGFSIWIISLWLNLKHVFFQVKGAQALAIWRCIYSVEYSAKSKRDNHHAHLAYRLGSGMVMVWGQNISTSYWGILCYFTGWFSQTWWSAISTIRVEWDQSGSFHLDRITSWGRIHNLAHCKQLICWGYINSTEDDLSRRVMSTCRYGKQCQVKIADCESPLQNQTARWDKMPWLMPYLIYRFSNNATELCLWPPDSPQDPSANLHICCFRTKITRIRQQVLELPGGHHRLFKTYKVLNAKLHLQ